MKNNIIIIAILILGLSSFWVLPNSADNTGMVAYPNGKSSIKDTLTSVVKTESEWMKILDVASYNVIRKKGTESAFSGAYDKKFEHGTYCCKACGLPLFSSTDKFNSGTGWPSYNNFINNHVEHLADNSHGWQRTEVVCRRCNGHLGHVFDDGPKPTGLRYCINSVSLIFKK